MMKGTRSRSTGRQGPTRWRALAAAGLTAAVLVAGLAMALRSGRASAGRVVATYPGTAVQSEEFARDLILRVSDAQRAREREALRGIAAPCCSVHDMSGRCCGCLLSRGITGLVRRLAARGDVDAASIRQTALAWIASTNPAGYTGRSCRERRCEKSFVEGGCGGGMATAEHRH
jgi:hypothetical protein